MEERKEGKASAGRVMEMDSSSDAAAAWVSRSASLWRHASTRCFSSRACACACLLGFEPDIFFFLMGEWLSSVVVAPPDRRQHWRWFAGRWCLEALVVRLILCAVDNDYRLERYFTPRDSKVGGERWESFKSNDINFQI
ncbi:dolichol phosphate-mannose biosynthesisregulatory protein-related [Striga asiatica]|uniref:Dolichol phosphate-mannose biosynthesisregulatory protein-related n=1 Tax=Striga asiatica TaxID=4170 RepID=A0A5A7QXD5_STRAF|nr:dolichol phosphate-mannose biosynthesisregulatory protein-related [Striga asiatica]